MSNFNFNRVLITFRTQSKHVSCPLKILNGGNKQFTFLKFQNGGRIQRIRQFSDEKWAEAKPTFHKTSPPIKTRRKNNVKPFVEKCGKIILIYIWIKYYQKNTHYFNTRIHNFPINFMLFFHVSEKKIAKCTNNVANSHYKKLHNYMNN